MDLYYDETKNVWSEYDDTYDITVHCENESEQRIVLSVLKNTAIISKVKEEINRQLHLPRYEHETENFDDGLKYISEYIDKLLK